MAQPGGAFLGAVRTGIGAVLARGRYSREPESSLLPRLSFARSQKRVASPRVHVDAEHSGEGASEALCLISTAFRSRPAKACRN